MKGAFVHSANMHMTLRRYPLGADGLPDRSAPPEAGCVCGIITRRRTNKTLAVPGKLTGGMALTVSCSSLDSLQAGDLLTGCGGCYRVTDYVPFAIKGSAGQAYLGTALVTELPPDNQENAEEGCRHGLFA